MSIPTEMCRLSDDSMLKYEAQLTWFTAEEGSRHDDIHRLMATHIHGSPMPHLSGDGNLDLNTRLQANARLLKYRQENILRK